MRTTEGALGKAMLWVSLLGCILLLGLHPGEASAQAAPWEAELTLTGEVIGDATNVATVSIGAADPALTKPAPPDPPQYTVSLKLYASDWSGPYKKDLRALPTQSELWVLALDPHGSEPPPTPRSATLSWDPDSLGVGAFELREGYDGQGAILVADMKVDTSYVFTGTGVSYYTIGWMWTPPPEAGIALSADSLDFGAVAIEDSSSLILRVYSVGVDTLEVTSLVPTADYSTVPGEPLPADIAPGDSLDVTVTFRPSAEGPIPGTLTIYSNDPDTPDTTVVLSGVGFGVPHIALSADSLDFGSVEIDSDSSQTLWIYSVGTDTLEVSDLSTTADYSAEPGVSLPAFVAPEDSLEVTVTFSPTMEGVIPGTLTITSNASDTTVVLSGVGFGVPHIELSADSLDFGSVEIDSSSSQALWIYSVGTDTLEVSGLSTTDDNYSAESGVSLPALVAPDDSLEVTVTFSPTREGAIPGTLTITSNAPDTTVALSGEGFGVPHIALSDTLLDFGNVLHGTSADRSLFLKNVGTDTLIVDPITVVPLDTFDIVSVSISIAEQTTIPPGESAEVVVRFTAPETLGEYEGILTVFSNDPDAPDTTVSLFGNSVETALGIEPDFLDFGDVLLGASKSDSLGLFNMSSKDTVWVDSLLVGEPEYTVSLAVPPMQTIDPGDTLRLEVTFEPLDLGEVPDILRVVYKSTLPEDEVREVPLSGRGVQQEIELSADSLDFGEVPLTLSLDETLIIYNEGTADLVVDSLVIDHDDFSVVSPAFPDTIGPSGYIEVTLRFEPSALGEAIGTLTVYSDDPDKGLWEVWLRGNGVPHAMLVINEVLVDPADGLAGDANRDGVRHQAEDEFIEILNIGTFAVDIGGWTLSDVTIGDEFAFPEGTVIEPDEYIVLFGGGDEPDPPFEGQVFYDDGTIGNGLNNNGDGIYLIDTAWSDTVASVVYLADWSQDQSFTRFPDGEDVDGDGDLDDPDDFVPHSAVAENEALFSPGLPVPLLASIAALPADTSIAKGTTAQYTAVGTYTDLSELDITDEVTWASSDEVVATIEPAGLATGHEQGTTDISASWHSINAVRDTIITGTATLTVMDSLLVSIAVSPMDTSVAKGRTVQYTAIGTYTDSTESDITETVDWSSSDENVATLEPTGLASTWGEGTTYITASADGFGGVIVSPEALLYVGPAVLDSIVVFPVERDSIVLFEGAPENPLIPGRQQFEAVGIFSDASTDTLTLSVLWASSDSSVAEVDGMGLAVADTSGWNVDLFSASRKGGSVEITASMDRPAEGTLDYDSFVTITGSSTLIVAPLGDVNNSFWWFDEPDVGDAIMVENIILHRPPEPEPPEWPSIFQSFAADRNTDFDINILDVVRIVMDVIERPFGAVPAKLASGVEEAAQVSLSKRVVGADRVIVPVAVSTSVPIAAAQVRLRYDPAILIPLAPELTDRSVGMRVNYSASEDGTLTILLSNLTGAVMPAGSGPIVYAAFGIIGEEEVHTGVTLEEILLSDNWGNSIPFHTTDVEVAAISSLPQAYSMSQNYPNPFNLQTVVQYALPEEGRVVIEVFGLTGQKIRTLVDEPRKAGRYTVVWDGKDGRGNEVASGVYLYRMHAGTFVDIKKMLLIK